MSQDRIKESKEAERKKELASLDAIAKSLGIGPIDTEKVEYAKRAAGLFNLMTGVVGRDYRGLFRQGATVIDPNTPHENACTYDAAPVCISDSLMIAVYAKVLGRTDLNSPLSKSCEDLRGSIVYSELPRVIYSLLKKEELLRKLPPARNFVNESEELSLLSEIKDFTLGKKTENDLRAFTGDGVAVLALNGIVEALKGDRESALKTMRKIDDKKYRTSESSLYTGSGKVSDVFASSCVGILLCVLAGADLRNDIDVITKFESV
jgi:hypothetical protein